MPSLVRAIGYGSTVSNTPVQDNMTCVLSDGTMIIGIVDTNQVGVTGDGGDNTGVPKLYIYSSPAGTDVWTLRATYTLSLAGASARSISSLAVDGIDNLHFCYINASNQVIYVKFTKAAGPTFTAGSNETAVAAAAGANVYTRVAIDVAGGATGTNVPIICVQVYDNTNPFKLRVAVRGTTTSTWATLADQNTAVGGTPKTYTNAMDMACDQGVIGANRTNFCVVFNAINTLGGDAGDSVYIFDVNTNTPALNYFSSVTAIVDTGTGGGYHRPKVFWTAAGTYLVASTIALSPWTAWVFKFSYAAGPVFNYFTSLSGVQSASFGTVTRTLDPVQFSDIMYTPEGKLIFLGVNANGVWNFVASIVDSGGSSTVTFAPGAKKWDDGFKAGAGSVVPPVAVHGGTHRNYVDILPVVSVFFVSGATTAYQAYSTFKQLPLAPNNVLPAASSTSQTDRPLLGASHRSIYNNAPFRFKAEWQLATNAGFTTSLRTVTEADADYLLPTNTASPSFTNVPTTEMLTALNELVQGTWFVRARSLDDSGAYGPYSASQSFSVSHPPAAANLFPTGGQIYVYGTGNITFDWDFTDPSGSDTQTAYQVVIENNDTSVTVTDTGKITGTPGQLTNAVVNIPIGSKGANLNWKVRLWDGDDVVGAYSGKQLFSVIDAPVPVISTPVDLSTITTGIPNITWNPGMVGIAVQAAYRVVITQGGNLIYDSTTILGNATSLTVPVGTLKNALTYSVTLIVTDNFGMQGSDTNAFTTSFTLPAVPGTKSVDITYYSSKGYVWITQDPSGFDTDFIAMNLYRRVIGDTTWTLIHQWFDPTKQMWYRDYLPGSNSTYQYAVTQMVDRFGDQVESDVNADDVIQITPSSINYWLLDPDNQSNGALPMYQVNAESFANQYEQQDYFVIGRGRHVDYGDRIGYAGQLSLQLRDKLTTGVPAVNYASNPSFTYRDPTLQAGALDWTFTFGGTGTNNSKFQATLAALPSNVPEPWYLAQLNFGIATTDFVQIEQLVPSTELPVLTTGDLWTLSVWWNRTESGTGSRNLDLVMIFETNVGGVLQTTTQDLVVASPVETAGTWERYQISATVPATAQRIRFRLKLRGNTTGSAASKWAYVTGFQLEKGSRTAYFDGDQLGCSWIATPGTTASQTSGYYTARQQRLDIEELKGLRKALYMRNAFGDVWKVAAGEISVERIPGTGANEFTNVTVPYQEVAF